MVDAVGVRGTDSTQRVAPDITAGMALRASPSGFIPPCLPSPAERTPSGAGWVYEIKHDSPCDVRHAPARLQRKARSSGADCDDVEHQPPSSRRQLQRSAAGLRRWRLPL